MTEQRTNDQQQGNEQTIANLKKLRQIASEQNREEFVSALDKAIQALSGDAQQEDKSDGLRLSTNASDMLDELANRARQTTLSPTERVRAAHHLIRLGGGSR